MASNKKTAPRAANSIADRAAKLDALFNAVVANAESDDSMKAAFKAAGGDQEEPRKCVVVARMSRVLGSKEAALLAFNKKGRGKAADTAKMGDDVRSVKEEKAYGAARTFLSSRLRVWGIKSASAQGGNRTGDNSRMSTDKLKAAPKPKVENSVELGAYNAAYAQAGYDFFLLNKAHEAVTSAHGSELMGAAADYLDTVKAINAKHNKA